MSFSNTFDTTNPGSAVSNREDLTSTLTILAPEETPILSSASKKSANATFVEWTVDKLADPITPSSSNSGIAEGADISQFTDKFAARARMGNYVQKFRRDYMVSDLQDAVESVGPAKIAEAEAKALREIKRDIEKVLASTQGRQQEDGTGNSPYRTAGLGAFLAASPATDFVPSGYETPTASRYTTTQANNNALTESSFNDLITSIYEVTGETNNLTLIADTQLRRIISDFARLQGSDGTSIRNVNYTGGAADIKLSVELYQSDHGTISVINGNPVCMPNYGATGNKGSGYFVNPEYYGVHELIPMGTTRLPNQGGGERGFVDCALTLGVYHPQAHGVIEQSKDLNG
jgi:hypothetical protein